MNDIRKAGTKDFYYPSLLASYSPAWVLINTINFHNEGPARRIITVFSWYTRRGMLVGGDVSERLALA